MPDNLVVLVKREKLASRPIVSLRVRSNIGNFKKMKFCSIFLRIENRNSPEGDKIEFFQKMSFWTMSTLDD